VGNLEKNILDQLAAFTVLHVLNADSKTSFDNQYATPQTLGVDRIALAMAGVSLFKNTNVLIIDAGSCITYDFVNARGQYLGGAISPGVEMRYKALHTFTAKLPNLSKEDASDSLIGDTTQTSMHSGVVRGILTEIDGIIDQYQSRFKDLTVILTGGDTLFLSKRLKNTIFADSKFLLKGLNYLLERNKH